MNDKRKTKAQLVEELTQVRARVAELESIEQTLLEERQLLHAFMDGIPDRVFFKDSESHFTRINKAQAQAFGIDDPQEVVGKTDFDFFSKVDAQRFYDGERRIMEAKQPMIDAEWQARDQDGAMHWRSVTKIPLIDESGDVVGLVGISRDITAQKQADEERTRLQQEVIEAQQHALQELSTPIIPVLELAERGSVVVMPLIGSIDARRAKEIMRSLLAGIREYRAQVVILDITGVHVVDSGVASELNKAIQAARLKGAQTIVTGIADAVAETIVDLGIDWSDISTVGDLQTGLLIALERLGYQLVKSE